MVNDRRKSPVNDPRRSPIPGWNSVKGMINKGWRSPTKELHQGRRTPTQELNTIVDIFCDESTAGNERSPKSVRPTHSRHQVLADVDVSMSDAESRAQRIERSRKRVENSRKPKSSRDHLRDYSVTSGSPTNSRRRRDQNRWPVSVSDAQVTVSPKRKSRSKSQEQRVESPSTLVANLSRNIASSRVHSNSNGLEGDEKLDPLRPDSRMSQYADDEGGEEEEEEDTIISQVAVVPVADISTEKAEKKVRWDSGVRSCNGSTSETDDDITVDSRVSFLQLSLDSSRHFVLYSHTNFAIV